MVVWADSSDFEKHFDFSSSELDDIIESLKRLTLRYCLLGSEGKILLEYIKSGSPYTIGFMSYENRYYIYCTESLRLGNEHYVSYSPISRRDIESFELGICGSDTKFMALSYMLKIYKTLKAFIKKKGIKEDIKSLEIRYYPEFVEVWCIL